MQSRVPTIDFTNSRFSKLKPLQLNELSTQTSPFRFSPSPNHHHNQTLTNIINNHNIKPTANLKNITRAQTGTTSSPYHKPQYSMDKGENIQLHFQKKDDYQPLHDFTVAQRATNIYQSQNKKLGTLSTNDTFKLNCSTLKDKANPISSPNWVVTQQGLINNSHISTNYNSSKVGRSNSSSYSIQLQLAQLYKKAEAGSNCTPIKNTAIKSPQTMNNDHSQQKVSSEIIKCSKENEQLLCNYFATQTPGSVQPKKKFPWGGSLINGGLMFKQSPMGQRSLQQSTQLNVHLQQSAQSSNKNHLQFTCTNHEKKKAKYCYQLNQDIVQYFCSKCAVSVAGNGIQVMEMSKMMKNVPAEGPPGVTEKQYKEKELGLILERIANYDLDFFEGQLEAAHERVNQQFKYNLLGLNNSCQQFASSIQLRHQELLLEMNQQREEIVCEINQHQLLIKEHQKEAMSIHQDISNNWDGVVNGIELQPFKEIIGSYYQKFQLVEAFLNQIKERTINLKSVKTSENIQQQLKQILFVTSDSQQLIDFQVEQSLSKKTVPTPIKREPKVSSATQRIRTEIDSFSQNQQLKKNSSPNENFYLYFNQPDDQQNENQTENILITHTESIEDSVQSCRANASSSLHQNNIYVSFENKEMFKSALEHNEQSAHHFEQQQLLAVAYQKTNRKMESGLHCQKTSSFEPLQEEQFSNPHSPASGQAKDVESRVKCQRDNGIQIPSEVKSKGTFRQLFETSDVANNVQTEERRSNEFQSSEVEKYKNVLDKISTNQSKTQQQNNQFYQNMVRFYQGILKSSNSSSPRYDKSKENESSSNLVIIIEILKPNQIVDDGQLSEYEDNSPCDEVVEIQLSAPSEGSESDLDINKKSKKKVNYQKSLFCSPIFKEDQIQDLCNSIEGV